jgi:hypothetical protein
MPASNTYDSIQSITLTSASSSVTLSSIPQTYTDLIAVPCIKTTANDVGVGFYYNSDNAGSNYSRTWLYGYSTTTSSVRNSNTATFGNMTYNTGASDTDFNVYNLNVMNYSNTTTYKTALWRAGNWQTTTSYSETGLGVGLWRNTSAITSITFVCGGGANFSIGSTFSLYGIKAA